MAKRKEEISTKNEENYSSTMIPFYDILLDKVRNMMKQKQLTEREDEETLNNFSSPSKKKYNEGKKRRKFKIL